MIDKLKGTRDFYPSNWFKINYIKDVCVRVSKRYGFKEIEMPIIEKAEIWEKKSGGEIPEQMYVFKDKNDEFIALRPETTPSLARMVAKKLNELKKPIKWFSFSRVFRYEQPQSGRLREFFQYNVDIIGGDDFKSSIETIALTIDILKEFGLDKNDFYVRLNNRNIVEAILRKFNVKDKTGVLQVIDKKEKVNAKEFIEMLEEKGVENAKELSFVFDKSIDELPELDKDGEEAKMFTKNVFKALKELGFEKYIVLDLSIVRGLSYYTGIVYEVFDKKKEFRAIAGGGAYDNLISTFLPDKKISGIGFGMGDVVLSLILERVNKMPEYNPKINYYIATIGNVGNNAFRIAKYLRDKSFLVDITLLDKNISKQMDYANKIGAKNIIIVGERDLKETNKITIKNLETGKEEKKELNEFLK